MEVRKIIEYDDTLSVFHELHHDSMGIVEVCHINKRTGKWYGKRRKYQTLRKKHLDSLVADCDNTSMYFSLNSFKTFSRRQENLFELKALWSDIDYYKTEYTKEQVLLKVDDLIHQGEIPPPTFIVDSGKGMYLIWKIQRTPPVALPRWQNLMKHIHSHLEDYGADSKCLEPSRIFRLDGSIHEETKKMVHVIKYVPNTYNMNHLRETYLSSPQRKIELEKPNTKSKTKSRNNKYTFSYTGSKQILYLYNQYKSYEARLQDIRKLCELRNYDLAPYHCREIMLFLTRYWTSCLKKDNELALQKALDLNSRFKDPLSEKEVINATKINEKAQKLQAYRYSNSTLIELLSISEAEQYNLSAIHTKAIQLKKLDEARKAERRNTSGLTKRQQQKLDTENKVRELLAKGYDNKQISEEIELSVRRVQQIIKAME